MATAAATLLKDEFDRVRESVHEVLDGLDRRALTYRVDADANTIAWLVWHLTRIEDDHVADVAGTEQAWLAGEWFDRFGLPFDRHDHGYGHTSEQVAQVDVDGSLLRDYHDAVHANTVAYIENLPDEDLTRIVDRRWDPPVTQTVRLVSVVNDCMQHVGQAAFVRGIVERGD